MKRLIPFLIMLVGFAGGVAYAQAAPDELVHKTTDEIISRIKANKAAYANDRRKLYAMVDELVLPNFDFRAMARLVLAQAWRTANEDQRTRFTTEFRDLLVRTYSTALLKYNNQKIDYLPYKGPNDDNTAVVRCNIKQSGGGPDVPLEYDFYTRAGAWKVYDVKIDGVSLVTNYRATYAEKVRALGLDALIASLSADNKTGGRVDPPASGAAKAKP
jgi:phospholipid transport system substrate-binding protein